MDLNAQIVKAKEMLDARIAKGEEVCVHVDSFSHTCRNAVLVDMYTLDSDNVYIAGGWYILHAEKPIHSIRIDNGGVTGTESINLFLEDGTQIGIDFV